MQQSSTSLNIGAAFFSQARTADPEYELYTMTRTHSTEILPPGELGLESHASRSLSGLEGP
jgi:hypothetical protein